MPTNDIQPITYGEPGYVTAPNWLSNPVSELPAAQTNPLRVSSNSAVMDMLSTVSAQLRSYERAIDNLTRNVRQLQDTVRAMQFDRAVVSPGLAGGQVQTAQTSAIAQQQSNILRSPGPSTAEFGRALDRANTVEEVMAIQQQIMESMPTQPAYAVPFVRNTQEAVTTPVHNPDDRNIQPNL